MNFTFTLLNDEPEIEPEQIITPQEPKRRSTSTKKRGAMIAFHITHTGRDGVEHEYDGLFASSVDALKDCISTFGIGGRAKVVPL